MTEGEWGLFVAEVVATFSGELDPAREAAMRRHFERVPYDVAQRTISTLVMAGQTFVPVPGEFMAALRRTVGPGWPLRVALSGVTSDELHERLLDEHFGPNGHHLLTEGSTS